MSNATVKVESDFYNRRLLDTEINGDQSRRDYRNEGEGNGSAGGFGGGGGRGSGGGVRMTSGFGGTELFAYLVRQHSLLGLYLSLRPRDEGLRPRCTVLYNFPGLRLHLYLCCCCCFLHINRSGLNHTQ